MSKTNKAEKIEVKFCGSFSVLQSHKVTKRLCGKRRPWASPTNTWLVGPGVAASCRRIFCGAPIVPSVELVAPWRMDGKRLSKVVRVRRPRQADAGGTRDWGRWRLGERALLLAASLCRPAPVVPETREDAARAESTASCGLRA